MAGISKTVTVFLPRTSSPHPPPPNLTPSQPRRLIHRPFPDLLFVTFDWLDQLYLHDTTARPCSSCWCCKPPAAPTQQVHVPFARVSSTAISLTISRNPSGKEQIGDIRRRGSPRVLKLEGPVRYRITMAARLFPGTVGASVRLNSSK